MTRTNQFSAFTNVRRIHFSSDLDMVNHPCTIEALRLRKDFSCCRLLRKKTNNDDYFAESTAYHPFANSTAWRNIRVRCWNRSDHSLLGLKFEVAKLSIFWSVAIPGDTRTRRDGNRKDHQKTNQSTLLCTSL